MHTSAKLFMKSVEGSGEGSGAERGGGGAGVPDGGLVKDGKEDPPGASIVERE